MVFFGHILPRLFRSEHKEPPVETNVQGTAVRGAIYHRGPEGKIHYLLVRRGGTEVENNRDKWQLPGGKKEDYDKNLDAAYRREIKEELGKDFTPWWMRLFMPSYLGKHSYVRRGGKYEGMPTTHHAYLQKVDRMHEPVLDPREHDAHAWVTLDAAKAMKENGDLVPGVVEILEMAHKRLTTA